MLLLEADSCLPLLHLTCVFLVFLMKCCKGSSLKPAQPMCNVRPFRLTAFPPPGGSRHGFPFRWVLHFVLSLTRSVIVHDAASCTREDSPYECGRPCDTMSCLFFTALCFSRANLYWCRRFSQPKMSAWFAARRCRPKPSHVYRWSLYSLSGRLLYLQNVNSLAVPLLQKDSNDDHLESTLPTPPHFRWRRDALQPPP